MTMLAALAFLATAAAPVPAGEQSVEPYVQSDTNAGGRPAAGDGLWRAFHGTAGVARIVDGMVDRNLKDPQLADIFAGQDLVRLHRTLREQFCYLLGGGCTYSGRDMHAAHKDLGIQAKDMNLLVTHLQEAMSAEGVPFFAQNRLLAKLAPMHRDIVER